MEFNEEMDDNDEAFRAGYKLVDSMLERNNFRISGIYPMWYGWALRVAFWAGVNWERDREAK
jgi:hypothetical protein